MTELDGLLQVDKPEGPTSHDVVAIARRALRLRRIGHTGTLDPFASGLLLLCLGPSTRLAEYVSALPKSYHAVIRLGEITDTDDRMGQVTSRNEGWAAVTEPALREALRAQVGVLDQLPPTHSAKKVSGERMYAIARRGETPARVPARVEVFAIELLRFDPPEVEMTVECSSGTYIRAIARDLGEALGVGGHLTALRRTRVGDFQVEGAVSLDRLDDPEAVRAALSGPAAAVAHLPRVVIGEQHVAGLEHGSAFPAPDSAPAGVPLAIFSADGALLAMGERAGERIQPRKVFA